MRKYSRLLSLVLLIATLFSMTSVGALAANDEVTTVVFGEDGNDVTGGSANGSIVISAEDDAKIISGSAAGSSVNSEDAEESVPVEAGSQYSILTTSASALDYFSSEAMLEENPMIYYNAKYIVYIREHMDELRQSNPDVVETAYALFGEKYMDMEFGKTTTVVSKSVALKSQAQSLENVIEKLEALVEDPTDADGILALRKAANNYRDTFDGVANYDFTDEESAFSTVDAALDAAKAELANINAEIAKLASNDASEEKKSEEKEEVEAEETPAPAATPTYNEALEEDTPKAASEDATVVDPTAPVLLMSPFEVFARLFAAPAYNVGSLAGTTQTLTSTVHITGLPNWPIIVCLDNAVLTAPAGSYAFLIDDTDTVVTIEACTIYGNAVDVQAGNVTLKFVKVIDNATGSNPAVRVVNDGSRLEIGNCEIEGNGHAAIRARDKATLAINGYNKIGNNSDTYAAVEAKSGSTVTIDNEDTTQSIISNVGGTGLTVDGAKTSVTANGNAKISGQSAVVVNNGTFSVNHDARLDAIGKGMTANAVNNAGGKVYFAGGQLYAEYGKAIESNGAPENTYIANGEDIIMTSKYDCEQGVDYTTGIITVNGQPVANIAAANNAIKNADTETVVVKLLGDVTAQKPLTVPADKTVSINGNGHALINKSNNAIEIEGTASINDISIEAPSGKYCIYVNGADANVNVGTGTIAKTGKCALYVDAGKASVNGMTMYCDNGVYAAADTDVRINSCKDNAANPIMTGSDKDSLQILGGFFLSKGTSPKVEEYLVKGVSAISSTTNSDGYYVVSMDYVPTVSVVNGTTGIDSNKIPYVVYDKANPKYITFNVDPKVTNINAVPINGGTTLNVFRSKDGIDGDITIDIDAFHMNLDAGVYDLQFEFANGYSMTNKLHLYVLPETVKLVARSNYQDASPSNIKASDIATAVNSFTVGSKAYIYAQVSELPTNIGVSADPNGNEVTWFGYYNGKVDDAKVLQKDGKYFILLDYAFLDQLAAGQDYIFLDYNGAIKRVDLKIINNNVKINPTAVDFWGADTQVTFTVTPDFKDVYIDGKLVPTQFVSYNNDTHKLVINGEYLKQLPSGEHQMEVETSRGWLSASIRTGVGLRPIDVDYHVYGGAKALAFVASDKIDTTAGIYIGKNNPTKVDPSLIYFYDNNTKFTLSPSYLNRLSLGTYYISAYVWNGEDYEYTSTTFRIVSASSAAYNPNTGDTFNPVLWLGIAALAAVVIVVILVPTLKKKKMVDKVEKVETVAEEVKEKASEETENKE